MASKRKHVGRCPYRFNGNPRELLFAEAWQAHNDRATPQPIDWLIGKLSTSGASVIEPATQAQCSDVATVIQWLGSPVGWGWLKGVIAQDDGMMAELNSAHREARESRGK